jgi:hypothetical protein
LPGNWRGELGDQRHAQPNTDGLDEMLQTGLGISGDVIGELEAQQGAGYSIAGRLTQLTLTARTFARISRLRQTLARGDASQVLDSEWEDLIEILVDVQRQRSFADWRHEGEEGQISLSADFFRARDPLVPGEGNAIPLIAWSARRDWEDTLAQRIEQEQSTIEAMSTAASTVETQVLPQLRASLIDAFDAAGATTEARAAWLAKRLLIDLQDDGCRMTTRIEQAMETLQGLLWSLRTGQYTPGLRPDEILSLCAVARGLQRMSLFARSSDDHLWQRDWSGRWQTWQDLGPLPTTGQGAGTVTLEVAAAAWDLDRVDLFVVGNDRALWQKTDDGAWASLGGEYQGRPTAVARGDGQIDLFVVGKANNSIALRNLTLSQGIWTDGENPPEKPFTSLCSTSWNTNRIDVFFGTAPLNKPLHRWWDGEWHSELLDGSLGKCTAVTWGEGRLDLFKNASDKLWHRSWDGTWQPWENLDTDLTLPRDVGIPATEPAACARQAGRIDVFLPRTGPDRRVWWRAFNLATGWEAWQPIEDLRLELLAAPEHFEATWAWLGSYAAWRAAMFVQLYPENLLEPTLRGKRQTPAFTDLAQKIREQTNPGQACSAASAYAAYAKDVCSLEVQATCQVPTVIAAGDGCFPEPRAGHFIHLFARAASRKVYSSWVDPVDRTGFRQSFWREVPGIANAEKIVGALPVLKDEQYSIALFAIVRKERLATLEVALLDVNSQTWRTFPPLDVPDAIDSLEIVPVQTNRLYPGDRSPRLAFHKPGSSRINIWWLDANGSSWAHRDAWDVWVPAHVVNGKQYGAELLAIGGLRSVAEYGINPYLTFTNKSGQLVSGRWVQYSGDRLSLFMENWRAPSATHLGAVISKQHPGVYVFYRRDGQNHFRHTGSAAERATMDGIASIAPHAGDARAGQQMFCFTSRRSSQPICLQYQEDTARADLLTGRWAYPARPRWSLDPDLFTPATAELYQGRRRHASDKAKADNANALSSTLTYLQEVTFFVPLHLALQLQRAGSYQEALDWFRTVYDYTAKPGERNISFVLNEDAKSPEQTLLAHGADWLHDPLDPHRIAASRRYAYTRFTIMAIVRCLLDYADAEFSTDTGESLARARTLYQTALDLLDVPELRQNLEGCDALSAELRVMLGATAPPEAQPGVGALVDNLTRGATLGDLSGAAIVQQFRTVLDQPRPWAELVSQLQTIAKGARSQAQGSGAIGSAVAGKAVQLTTASRALLTHPRIDLAVHIVGAAPAPRPAPPAPAPGVEPIVPAPQPPVGLPAFTFCVPPNPAIRALRLRAEANLAKLRTCRNIAGMKRELDPYGAPTDASSGMPVIGAGGQITLPGVRGVQPTLYRYADLIDRAKQLVQLASQIEAQMLAALEKRDAEAYNLLRARQELGMAQAQVTLQQLRVIEAQSGVGLAQLQRRRAEIQRDTYSAWITAGELELEKEAKQAYEGAARAQLLAADISSVYQAIGNFTSTGSTAADVASKSPALAGAAAAFIGAGVIAAQIYGVAKQNELTRRVISNTLQAQLASINAAIELRKRDWQLQQALAQQDVAIAGQQIAIANQHVDVTRQERRIAELQTSNAQATIEFLNGKFTNQELYDWMAGVLEGVYRTFLQQATAMAKLAEAQLAFERQEAPLAQIKANYWTVSSPNALQATDGNAQDRRGLTGSARLLQDIYQLDQYAFDTDKRKLQITKSISLAQLLPFEFQRFRETGVLSFATPIELFDRDFPGHYLRLIRRVRTSVIALVPPAEGIRATLTASGISRVVVGSPGSYQRTTIRREPETVALSAPISATGLFELEQQPGAMYLPFENNGVDTSWELRLPKASNPFDFRTIADVLVTIEYTALNSFDYQQQVIQQLSPMVRADRVFGLREQFPDAWYDLHNPELLEDSRRMRVSLPISRDDFPPNLDQIHTEQVLMVVVRAEGMVEEVAVERLSLTQPGLPNGVGGGGTTIDGVISTRRGNGSAWTAMIGKSPFGTWEIALPNTEQTIGWFKDEQIENILLVITYGGRTPPWPV